MPRCAQCGTTTKSDSGLDRHISAKHPHPVVPPAWMEDLRADYEILGRLLGDAEGTAAAAIARERRLIGEKLEQLEPRKEATVVDELAAKRARAGSSRPPARRRQS